jgi:hypothetical protein
MARQWSRNQAVVSKRCGRSTVSLRRENELGLYLSIPGYSEGNFDVGQIRYLFLDEEMVDGAWVQVGDPGATSDSLSVSGLLPNTSYEFRVAAVSPSGTTWSTAQSVTTLRLPHVTPTPGVVAL